MKQIARVGVDIAKSVFHVYGVDRHDRRLWERKLKRANWIQAICDNVPVGAVIAMEACAGAHQWARELQSRGYIVRLIAAKFVKPYVKSNKNDRADAEAICEAAGRPNMRFVGVKTVAQQDIQSLHRVRAELIKQRTALANQIRGLVAEYGIVAPVGIAQLRKAIPCWLEDAENGLTEFFRTQLSEQREDLQRLDERVAEQDKRVKRLAKEDPVAQLLMTLRGVGPLSATGLSVALGDGKSFKKGRDFAASLGIVPKQNSTGGKDQLLGISKRGDSYLRKLLVHGARAVIQHSEKRDDPLSQWVNRLVGRKHINVATVALANKTARMAWAIAHGGVQYDPNLSAATQS